MPIDAHRLIRKMRGGAQAHLMEASDGHFYVVKFRNNPQHRRILLNEAIAGVFFRYLKISSPETAVINISPEFIAANPEMGIQLGNRRVEVEPGWHFGSRYPGDPTRTAVYDFVPDALLDRVVNVGEFLGALVLDKWMCNADSRQSVFFRARLRDWVPSEHPARIGFVAMMVDHGYAFNGPYWDFPDSPLQGLYFRPSVYSNVRGFDDFQPWIEQVVHFPVQVLDEALKQVPAQWLEGDAEALEALFERLLRRRERVPDLLRACRTSGRINPFPKWT
jgi:hypothetical protein